MNNKPGIVSLDVIDEDDLHELIDKVESLTSAKVVIERQFVLTSDSPSVLTALENLFGNGNGSKPAIKKKAARKILRQPGLDVEPTRGRAVRSIKVIATGEMISRIELTKRLKEKTIADGTELHSPKHGNIRVVQAGEDLILQNSDGEQI